jgi:hypothetical protein
LEIRVATSVESLARKCWKPASPLAGFLDGLGEHLLGSVLSRNIHKGDRTKNVQAHVCPYGDALMLGGSMMWTAHATSTNTMDAFPSAFSPIEKIGCEGAGEKCPYGYTIERHGRKGWSCKPCWDQRQGSRYRDWNDRDYGPRRYRDYDERYNEPRRYPREY